MTNRVAWGLAAVLALLLVIGAGTMLYCGVSFPGVFVRVYAPGSLPVGTNITFYRHLGFWEVSRSYDLRVCLVIVYRTYKIPPEGSKAARSQAIPPPTTNVLPSGHPASLRRGTGRQTLSE
jgi:hypothetical protein